MRRDYETGVVEGRYPEHVTLSPLYPYQREGMLHLAFAERALLADEMGLGKTIQAVAACALLHHLGKARRVLIVTPASLKAEWEEQIRRFTTLDERLVYASRSGRLKCYADPAPPFFTIVNYEQVVSDSLEINHHLRPDIVVLDEAQRIKNWATKTARAVKRLQSRYAFVLTGTPIENRIDELYSIVDFLDSALLGPLFRFNRDFYTFDEKGRQQDYRNLVALRERVKPVLLRRRKHQTRPVTVINLVAENTIEYQMLSTLALKFNLAQGVLDGSDESLSETKLKRGADAHLSRLNQFLNTEAPPAPLPRGHVTPTRRLISRSGRPNSWGPRWSTARRPFSPAIPLPFS